MSEKFKFSLEKLLEIRTDKEEESKRSFNKSQMEKKNTEDKLEELKKSYEKYNGINKGESLTYQKIKKNYLFALNKSISQTENDLIVKEKEVEIRRQDLIKKQIERKTVDILKEKKEKAFYKEQDRLEQIINDEMALYAYMRNQ